MDITLDGGLNLGDPQSLQPNQLSISQNADFRKDGVVRSRDGRILTYSTTESELMINADQHNSFIHHRNEYLAGAYLHNTLILIIA